MSETKEKKRQAESKPETREQKRYRERINSEATAKIKTLQDHFLNFFTECEDPEGPEVLDKMKQISAQWRTHCKRRHLIHTAYVVLDQYMAEVVTEYFNEKEGNGEKEEVSESAEAIGSTE